MPRIPVLHLPKTPLADRFVTDQPRYPLDLSVDTGTWLLSLDQTDAPPDAELFGADYGFQTSASPSLVHYFDDYATWIKKNLPDEVRRGVVEIGCNDGTLLQHFEHGPISAIGVDPCRAAASPIHWDQEIINKPFTAELAKGMGPTDRLVIANNVLAHVADLDDTLEGIAHLVGTSGAAVIEFGYAGDLLANADYPLVYHEHRRFFSLTSLVRLLYPHDLVPVSVLHTPQQGGSLRVTVRPIKVAVPDASAAMLYARESWLRRRDTYTSFQGRVDHLRNRLTARVLDEHDAGRRIALIGASAKATTLLHATGIDGVIEFAEDLTPYKLGKVMPGTDIPIMAPGYMLDRDTTYIIGVPNYLGAILRAHPDRRMILTPGAEIIS